MHCRSAIVAALLTCCTQLSTGAAEIGVVQARAELEANYRQQLVELAAEAHKLGLEPQAAQAAGWLPRRDPDKIYLFALPASADQPAEAAAGESDAARDWAARFRKLRAQQAEALMELAGRAIREQRGSLAYELVLQAGRENPDHKRARALLGYLPFRGGWHTPFEIEQLKHNKVWHDKFGWLSVSYVKKYEQGKRYHQGRWIKAEEEARLRADIKKGWRIESEHYVVTTNDSLESGVELSRRLERLHAFWRTVFIRYLAGSEQEIAKWFEGRAAVPASRQHNVVYFRSRDEYNQALVKAQPKIGMTLGIYFDNTQAAYFFAGKQQQAGTVYHEASHQLFQETRSVAADVGRKDNFWIIEAIACYMESLTEHDGYFTLGGFEMGRMPAARVRLLDDNFYVALAELTTYGMDSLQRDPNIAKLYSQSAGLATFLMHAEAGRYREPLAAYLEAVYTGRATPQTLAELTGASYADLDRQYREFLSRPAGHFDEKAEARK